MLLCLKRYLGQEIYLKFCLSVFLFNTLIYIFYCYVLFMFIYLFYVYVTKILLLFQRIRLKGFSSLLMHGANMKTLCLCIYCMFMYLHRAS
jgi:hypothetical protein